MGHNFFCIGLVCITGLVIWGCSSEESQPIAEPVIRLICSEPANGSAVDTGDVAWLPMPIRLHFNYPPSVVTVDGTAAHIVDNIATWKGRPKNYTGGKIRLPVVWQSAAGSYGRSYITLFTYSSGERPKVTDASVHDGDRNVDPVPLNQDGITLKFNEAIAGGKIDIRPKDGGPLGWIAEWTDTSMTIKPPPGKELINERIYSLWGIVIDLAGNERRVQITFVTQDEMPDE